MIERVTRPRVQLDSGFRAGTASSLSEVCHVSYCARFARFRDGRADLGLRAERVYEVGNQWPGSYEDGQEHGGEEDGEAGGGLVVGLVEGVDGE